MPTPTTPTVEITKQILGLIGLRDPFARGDVEEVGRALRGCSRDELLAFSKQLGLTGVTKLAKDALAERVAAALDGIRGSANVEDLVGDGPDSPTGTLPAKFDLGPDTGEDQLPASIPWGYSSDRVTAMPVDPVRLYVYWEVTDGAIEAARKELGKGGAAAWLCVRVYDITGRLFDGTNAHSYFDEGVGREVRQWFFEIGKPTSTACVEIGLKSNEGFFARIARSGRVDFPRDAPMPAAPVEWLTVRTATGYAGEPVAGGAPRVDSYGGALGGASGEAWQGWTEDAGFPVPGVPSPSPDNGVAWTETTTEHVRQELGRFEWTGPVLRSEWQAGPFSYPVDVPSMLELHESGEVSMRTEDGIVHVVYGPWQVVIRGAGARAERRVLATWEYKRAVEVPGGMERDEIVVGSWEPVAPGSSAMRLVGSSERRWLGSSELVGRGGSEMWMMGASERLMRGASERLYRGASERLMRGASERLMRGASERVLGGASERTFAGGFPGASERRLGASENVLAASAKGSEHGASNGASNGVSKGSTGPLPYPSSGGSYGGDRGDRSEG